MMEKWPMREVEERKRRGAILRYLTDVPGTTAGIMLTIEACRAQGIPTDFDQAAASLDWLETHCLVTLQGEDTAMLARATPKGKAVARDQQIVRGVERPE